MLNKKAALVFALVSISIIGALLIFYFQDDDYELVMFATSLNQEQKNLVLDVIERSVDSDANVLRRLVVIGESPEGCYSLSLRKDIKASTLVALGNKRRILRSDAALGDMGCSLYAAFGERGSLFISRVDLSIFDTIAFCESVYNFMLEELYNRMRSYHDTQNYDCQRHYIHFKVTVEAFMQSALHGYIGDTSVVISFNLRDEVFEFALTLRISEDYAERAAAYIRDTLYDLFNVVIVEWGHYPVESEMEALFVIGKFGT